MKCYEDDRDIEIPKWYLKLPKGVICFLSDFLFFYIKLKNKFKRKKKEKNTSNIKFYI